MPSKWPPTERSDPSYLWVLQQHPILGQGHQSSGGQEFHHIYWPGRKPTDRNQTQLRSLKAAARWWFVIVQPNHSWWWPFVFLVLALLILAALDFITCRNNHILSNCAIPIARPLLVAPMSTTLKIITHPFHSSLSQSTLIQLSNTFLYSCISLPHLYYIKVGPPTTSRVTPTGVTLITPGNSGRVTPC